MTIKQQYTHCDKMLLSQLEALATTHNDFDRRYMNSDDEAKYRANLTRFIVEAKLIKGVPIKLPEALQFEAGVKGCVNLLADWMTANGFATGHGDSMEDLLSELDWQLKEIRNPGILI